MTLVRASAWLGGLIAVILSVVPGRLRPHVMGDSDYELFTAYLISAGLLAIGYLGASQLLANGAALTICAGVLQVVQFSIPGRTASISSAFSPGGLAARCPRP